MSDIILHAKKVFNVSPTDKEAKYAGCKLIQDIMDRNQGKGTFDLTITEVQCSRIIEYRFTSYDKKISYDYLIKIDHKSLNNWFRSGDIQKILENKGYWVTIKDTPYEYGLVWIVR